MIQFARKSPIFSRTIVNIDFTGCILVLIFINAGYVYSAIDILDLPEEPTARLGAGLQCYIAMSPDGKILASAGGAVIYLWDIETKSKIGELRGHTANFIPVLAFSPDGSILASAGGADDMAVYIWDTQTWEQIGALEGHPAHVGGVAYSADGKFIASTSYWDDKVRIWDAEAQELIGLLHNHLGTDMGDGVVFSPDGKWLATGSKNGVELWELNLADNAPEPVDDPPEESKSVKSEGKYLVKWGEIKR